MKTIFENNSLRLNNFNDSLTKRCVEIILWMVYLEPGWELNNYLLCIKSIAETRKYELISEKREALTALLVIDMGVPAHCFHRGYNCIFPYCASIGGIIAFFHSLIPLHG